MLARRFEPIAQHPKDHGKFYVLLKKNKDSKYYLDCNIESRRDDTALVDAAVQLNNNLSRAVVIDNLELSDVSYNAGMDIKSCQQLIQVLLTVLLHDLQELDNNLGGWSDQDLTLSTLLSIGNGLEDIGEHRHLSHLIYISLKKVRILLAKPLIVEERGKRKEADDLRSSKYGDVHSAKTSIELEDNNNLMNHPIGRPRTFSLLQLLVMINQTHRLREAPYFPTLV